MKLSFLSSVREQQKTKNIYFFLSLLVVLFASVISSWSLVKINNDISSVLFIVWPAGGIVLGLSLLGQTAKKSIIFILVSCLGLLIGSSFEGSNWFVISAPIAFIRTFEIFLSWSLLTRLVGLHQNLGHPSVLQRFTVVAVLTVPALSGGLATIYSHYFTAMNINSVQFFINWWSSSALGMALFAPLIVSFRREEWAKLFSWASLQNIFGPVFILSLLTFVIFIQDRYPFSFMVIAPLLWLVFRWGFAGAALGSIIIGAISFPLTALQYGPISEMMNGNLFEAFFVLQVYLGTIICIAYPVGMILDHRHKLMLKLKKREQELYYASTHDPLTNLLNRRGFDDVLEQELNRAQNEHGVLSAAVIDVDYFKLYNDTYGHSAGDECLIWLATIVEEWALKVNAIPSRQGGEEFGVILPQTDAVAAEKWANELCRYIAESGQTHNGSPFGIITISIGLATRTSKGRSTDTKTLLQDADSALYHAKNQGRNRVVLKKRERRDE